MPHHDDRRALPCAAGTDAFRSIAPDHADVCFAGGEEGGGGALLNVDLDEALALYVRERVRLVERLQQLSEADWQRTAAHEEYSHYSVWIMFRQLLLHEMQHAYRIEELRLKQDWA